MSQISPNYQRYCPYLGLHADRASIFTQPAKEHRCYIATRRQRIDLDHQAAFCLTSAFEGCPQFVPKSSSAVKRLPAVPEPVLPASKGMALVPPSRLPAWLMVFLEEVPVLQLAVWIIIAFIALAGVYSYLDLRRSLTRSAPPAAPALAVAVPTPSPTVPPTETLAPPEAVPVMALTPMPLPPTATRTQPPSENLGDGRTPISMPLPPTATPPPIDCRSSSIRPAMPWAGCRVVIRSTTSVTATYTWASSKAIPITALCSSIWLPSP